MYPHQRGSERMIEKYNKTIAALKEIEQGKGPYNRDHRQFATNVIENMKSIAKECLDELEIKRDVS